MVSFNAFEDYFANLSVFEDSEEAFADMMKVAWDLDDKKPPPVLLCNARSAPGPDAVLLPRAKQAHGDCITWEQEQSELECQSIFVDRTRRVIQFSCRCHDQPAVEFIQQSDFISLFQIALFMLNLTNLSR